MSTFKDELNKNTKSQSQVADEKWQIQSQYIEQKAQMDYKLIKNLLLDKAQKGMHLQINDKKYILVEIESGYIQGCIVRKNNSTSRPKIFGRGNVIYGNVSYNLNYKEYEYYLKMINELSSKDEISIEPIFKEIIYTYKRNVNLPYTYNGQSHIAHEIKAFIKCSIEY